MGGFQALSPCKGMISPNLSDVSNKHIMVQKIEHFAWPIRELKRGV
jgi:hypothetical protein